MHQLCPNSRNIAPKARNMKVRGKGEAKRSASPLVGDKYGLIRPERPEYYALSGLQRVFNLLTRGDALRFASRLPLVGDKYGLIRPERPEYYALSGLQRVFNLLTRGDALRFASRLPLAVISRAFGALALLVLIIPGVANAQFKPTDYARTEAMIPMRDGVRLYTQIDTPTNATDKLPILLLRTPYGHS